MAKFLKDALYPGKWHLPDGRVFDCPPELCRHLAQRARDMLAAKLSIPLAWEHQDTAKPLTEAERQQRAADLTRTTPGYVEAADLDPAGFLSTLVEVPVAGDAERLPAARFVSPEIVHDFVDGTGRLWPGPSITHLAVTPRPVQPGQQPFKPVALSQAAPIRLSLTGYTPIRLGEPMADEPKPADKGKKGEGEGGAGEGAKLKKVLGALAKIGMVLPDDTTPESLLDRLHTAALTKEASDNPVLTNDEPAAGSGANPVNLSLEKRLQAAEAQLVARGRQDLQRRLDVLRDGGWVTPDIHRKLTAQLGTVQLSLGEGGLAPSAVQGRVEAYEELAAGGAQPACPVTRLSDGGTPVPLPPEATRGVPQTAAEAEAVVDQIYAAMGRGKK